MTKKIFLYFFVLGCLLLKAQVSTSGCYLSGGMTNGKTAGCGNSPTPCNFAATSYSIFGAFCGSSVTTGSGSQVQVSSSFILPAGCSATVEVEMKPRTNIHATGCNNSGADGNDFVAITSSGGVVASEGATICCTTGACGFSLPSTTTSASGFTTGCSNSTMISKMIVTGGTVTLIGKSDRADEITTYTINLSGTCGSNCDAVLPILLKDFYAEVNENHIELNWTVATEDNVDYYIIEKSYDGNEFLPLEKVPSIAPQAGPHNLFYSAVDYSPFRPLNYYRLKSFDYDGSSQLSKLITVPFSSKHGNEIIISYTENEVSIKLSGVAKNKKLTISDLTGREVKQLFKSGQDSYNLVKKELPGGMYILAIDGTQVPSEKLIIQH